MLDAVRRNSIRLGVLLAAATVCAFTGLAHAQSGQFDDAQGNFRSYVVTVCGTLRDNERTSVQNDLFLRCNAALQQPDDPALTAKSTILDQYVGVQNIAQQSDGALQSARPSRAVAGRVSAIAEQVRGRQFAAATRPILLASNNPDEVSIGSMERPSALDGFLSIGGFDSEQDSTARELGFEQDGWYIAGGLDYMFSSKMTAGVAVNYVTSEADFDGIGDLASGGSMDTDSWMLSGYGVYAPADGLVVTGLIGFGQTDYDNTRLISLEDRNALSSTPNLGNDSQFFGTIDRTASSSTSADTAQLSLGVSYAAWQSGATSFTPSADLSYYTASIDGFSETGSDGLDLEFDEQDVDSVQFSLGGEIAHAISTETAVFVPYARARAIFELQDNAQSVSARYVATEGIASIENQRFTISTNPADDNSYEFAIGASMVRPNGLAGFVEVQTVAGLDNVDYKSFSAGLRIRF